MNMNDFAKKVTLIEGKKRQVSIAQVKEIIRIVLIELADMPTRESNRLLRRYYDIAQVERRGVRQEIRRK